MKKLILLMLMVMVVSMMSFVNAADVDVVNVKCYPDSNTGYEAYDRGQSLGGYVEMSSKTDLKDVQVKMSFSGNNNDKIETKTGLFDMDKDTTHVKRLSLTLPEEMDLGKYHMRFQITDKNSLSKTCYVPYHITAQRNLVTIKDNVVQQSTAVDAGGFLQVKSLVKNIGQKEQDWMKVTLEVASLGISDSSYFTSVPAGKSVEFDGLLKIPSNAKADNYFAKLKVLYYDGDSTTVKTIHFTVKERATATAVTSSTSSNTNNQVLTAATTQNIATSNVSSLLKTALPVALVVLVVLAIVLGLVALLRR